MYGLAQGPVSLEDPSDSNVGVVTGGGVMDADIPIKYIDNGTISLIIEAPSANWTNACIGPTGWRRLCILTGTSGS